MRIPLMQVAFGPSPRPESSNLPNPPDIQLGDSEHPSRNSGGETITIQFRNPKPLTALRIVAASASGKGKILVHKITTVSDKGALGAYQAFEERMLIAGKSVESRIEAAVIEMTFQIEGYSDNDASVYIDVQSSEAFSADDVMVRRAHASPGGSYGNYIDTKNCISRDDLAAIAKEFSQFKKFITSQDYACKEAMDERWFGLAQTFNKLRKLPDIPVRESDSADGLTFVPINERNWWSYFTKRVSRIRFAKQSDNSCHQGFWAYVSPDAPGVMNLCPIVDTSNPLNLEIYLHEARHFDGDSYHHVTCTRGNEQGRVGVCDPSLEYKGSYAVSMFVDSTLGRDPGEDEISKQLFRVGAIYFSINRFNKAPKLAITSHLLASSNDQDFWDLLSTSEKSIYLSLPERSKIYASTPDSYEMPTTLTIFPNNVENNAYRLGAFSLRTATQQGITADLYNSLAPADRQSIRFTVYSNSGNPANALKFLEGNSLSYTCGENSIRKVANERNFESVFAMPYTWWLHAAMIGRTTDGKLLEIRIDCEKDTITYTESARFEKLPKLKKVLASYDGKLWGFLTTGEIVRIQEGRKGKYELVRNSSPLALPSGEAITQAIMVSYPTLFVNSDREQK